MSGQLSSLMKCYKRHKKVLFKATLFYNFKRQLQSSQDKRSRTKKVIVTTTHVMACFVHSTSKALHLNATLPIRFQFLPRVRTVVAKATRKHVLNIDHDTGAQMTLVRWPVEAGHKTW